MHAGSGVPLSLENRWIGDVPIVVCSGRIVEGAEASALEQHVLGESEKSPHLVLHLGGVDFIDSSGIGLLVRLATRLRNANGGLGLCAVPPRIRELLTVTRLHRILEPHESEADAISAAFRQGADPADWTTGRGILCVEPSADVLAYVRELLRSAGYAVVTASNLPDGLTLLTATRPRAVIVGREVRAMRNTMAAQAFNERAEALPIIELPGGFSTDDAAHAARQLLSELQAAIGPPEAATT